MNAVRTLLSVSLAMGLVACAAAGEVAPSLSAPFSFDGGRGPAATGALVVTQLSPLGEGGPDLLPRGSWIGGPCRAASECTLTGSRCLTAVPGPLEATGIAERAVTGGLCTLTCAGSCPDSPDREQARTFCVDGRPLAHLSFPEELDDSAGLCVARCDPVRFPRRPGQPAADAGCAPGHRCRERNRFGKPGTTAAVCVPGEAAESSCPAAADGDLLLELDYPDRGALFIPAEARCGGELDLVVALHGLNPVNNVTPALGGGRRMELDVRALIDAGLVRPLLIAEPVHFRATSDLLYGDDFSPAHHLDLVRAELASRRLRIGSLSYTGHSGAGCHTGNGISKVLGELASLVPTFAPVLKLVGLQDVCYGGPYHYQDLDDALRGHGTTIVSYFSVNGDPLEFESGFLPDGVAIACQSSLYSSCIAARDRPWCSYRTRRSAAVTHDSNPAFFIREIFPQVFGPAATAGACQVPL